VIERSIEFYLSGGSQSRPAKIVAAEGSFSQKAGRLDRLLRAFGEDHPSLAIEGEVARRLLKNARQLAERRNAYIHALTSHDYLKNETKLIMKGVATVCDEKDIERLDMEIIGLLVQLAATASELFKKAIPE
jgi:hypothetical protein